MPLYKSEEEHVDGIDESVKPWKQPAFLTGENPPHENKPAGIQATTYKKTPYQEASQYPSIEESSETFFHPQKAMNDLIEEIRRNTAAVEMLYKQMLLERTFSDEPVGIGLTVNYSVDYKDRKYLYVMTWSAITFVVPQGTLGPTVAGRWFPISLPRGTSLTVQGGSDSVLTACTFRHCDVIMN